MIDAMVFDVGEVLVDETRVRRIPRRDVVHAGSAPGTCGHGWAMPKPSSPQADLADV